MRRKDHPIKKFLFVSCCAGGLLGLSFTAWVSGLGLRLLLACSALLIFLFVLKQSWSQKMAFFCGTFFGWSFFLLSFFDLKQAFSFVGLGYLGFLGVALLSLLLSLFISIPSTVARLWSDPKKCLLSFCFLWAGCEYIRSTIFPQIPLNLLFSLFSIDSSFIGDCMIQSAGMCLYSFSAMILAFMASFALQEGKKVRFFSGAILLSLFVYGYSQIKSTELPVRYVRQPQDMQNTQQIRIKIALIQPNIAQKRKMDPSQNAAILTEILDWIKTAQTSGGDQSLGADSGLGFSQDSDSDIDCIILPESAIPGLISADFAQIKQIQETLKSDRTVLIFGADREASEFGSEASEALDQVNIHKDDIQRDKTHIKRPQTFFWHNSLFVISKQKVLAIYDKARLLAFGEYIPYKRFLPEFIRKKLTGIDGTPGKNERQIISIEGLPAFLPKICSESLFPYKIGKSSSGSEIVPKWIVMILNDEWFGPSLKLQHLAMDRLRSIKFRLPIVRVSNGGVSVVIDGSGRIQENLPLSQAVCKTVVLTVSQ